MTLTFEIGNPYYDFTRYSCYIGVGVPTFEVMHPIALAKKKHTRRMFPNFFFRRTLRIDVSSSFCLSVKF